MKYFIAIQLLLMAILVHGSEKPDENLIGKWNVDEFNELLIPMKFNNVKVGRIKEIEIGNRKIEILCENIMISPVSTIFIKSDKFYWAACVWMYDDKDPFVSEQFQILFGLDGDKLKVMQMIDGKKTDIKYVLSKIVHNAAQQVDAPEPASPAR